MDSLWSEAGRTDSEPLPTEYRQALDLARILATTDFSAESRVRHALRRRLLNQIGAREGWQRRKEYAIRMRNFFWKRHPALILITAVLAVFLVVTLAWPGVLRAVAQVIYVRILSVGEHTTVIQVDPGSAALRPRWTPSAQPRVEQRWTIRTPIGKFSNIVGFGQDPTVHYFTTFDEAQAITPFCLHQPAYLPASYAFLDVMVAPSPNNRAFLFYSGPDGEIVLIQASVYGQLNERPGSSAVYKAIMFWLGTDKPIEEVTLNGQRAA